MSARPVLAGGQALAAWIRAGGRPDRAPAASVWLYRWRGYWFEKGLSLLPPASSSPRFPGGRGLLFILGFWRSGTTVLHEMVAGAPGWRAPETWQCMDPLAALRGGSPPEGAAVRRPMDSVEVGPRSPQEDEFALLALGVPSLYRGFLDPRRLPDLQALLDQAHWLGPAAAPWMDTLAGFLEACAPRGDEGLVVKSPNHVFRVQALDRRFPEARSIWILRDPADLWASNLRMWRAMTDRYGLWAAPDGALEAFLGSALEAYRRTLEALAREGRFRRDLVLEYGALVQDPVRALTPLAHHLGLDGGPGQDWIQASAARLKETSKDRKAGLPEGPGRLLAELRDLHRAILSDSAP